MPWNGRHDVLIDRFDARAVLDMVPLSPQVPHATSIIVSSTPVMVYETLPIYARRMNTQFSLF